MLIAWAARVGRPLNVLMASELLWLDQGLPGRKRVGGAVTQYLPRSAFLL